MIYSNPINVTRYSNGTLVQIMASAHGFTSTDYNPETHRGTYLPNSITLTARTQTITLSKWQRSTDGTNWTDITDGDTGYSISGNVLTVTQAAISGANVIIKAVGSDATFYDTVMLTKEVDPTYVYDRTHTEFNQTNDKIALIASEEQLAQFSESSTMVDKMASIEVKADEITSTVTANYATKTYAEQKASAAQTAAVTQANAYADDAAESAVDSANDYTDGQLASYSTTAQVESKIDQKADQIITSVSASYATKEELASSTNGTFIFQTPYSVSNNVITLNGVVYRNSEDVTEEFDPEQFEWFINDERKEQRAYIGNGKSISIDRATVGYGSTVVGVLTVLSDEPLIDESENELIDASGNWLDGATGKARLEVETFIFSEEAIENKFAEIEITADGIISEVHRDYAKTEYVDSAAAQAETNANEYADTAAQGAYDGAVADTDNKLLQYTTTVEMESRISQTADEIMLNVSEDYTTKAEMESATNGMVTFQTPYAFRDKVVTFNARIYRNLEDVTADYSDEQFEWLLYTEDNSEPDVIGEGKTVSVDLRDVGYGGTVIGRFRVYDDEELHLIDADENELIDASWYPLEAVEVKSVLEVSTPLYQFEQLKSRFADIDITTEQIKSEVADVYEGLHSEIIQTAESITSQVEDVAEGLHSEIEQTADGIRTEVSGKVGYSEVVSSINQSAEEIAIDASKISLNGAVTANNNVKINLDGSIEMIAGLIGLIHIISNAIYSGDKSTYNSSSQGFYLGADGHFALGDGDYYLRWIPGQNKSLEMNVKALTVSGKSAATSDDIEGERTTAHQEAENAAKTASNYLYFDGDSGLVVSPTGQPTGTQASPFNTQIFAGAINFRKRNNILATIDGDNLIFNRGTSGKPGIKVTATDIEFYKNDGVTVAGKIDAGGFNVLSGLIGAIHIIQTAIYSGDKSRYGDRTGYTTESGFYFGADGKIDIGNGNAYIRWDGSNLSLMVNSLRIGGANAATTTDLDSVRTTANNALSAASDAETAASEAQTAASGAQTAAAGAQTAAQGAATSADTAQSAAQGAASSASSAQAAAGTAASSASTAQQAASRAASSASSAQASASNAQTLAGQALSTAGDARDTAGDALLLADDAMGTATTASETATAASEAASTAQTTAENAAHIADNYIYYSTEAGLVLTGTGERAGATGTAERPFNTQITAGAINFRNRSTVLMSLEGTGMVINRGLTSKRAVVLTTEGLSFYRTNGNDLSMSLTDNALTFYGTGSKTGVAVAAVGASGIEVRQGTIGAFVISNTSNNGNTASGGHVHANSLYSHAASGDYEYEYGLRGGSTRGNIVFYVARIASGATWASPTYITSLTMDGTFTTVKANIGGWTVSENKIEANKIALEAGSASSGALIRLGNFNKGTNIYRTTAYIDSYGNISGNKTALNVLSCADSMYGELTDNPGWRSFDATRSGVKVYQLLVVGNDLQYSTTKGVVFAYSVPSYSSGTHLGLGSDGMTLAKVASSSKRYKDIDRLLTEEDIEAAYNIGVYRAKYKDGYLMKGDRMEGKYMPMLIAEEVEEHIPEAAVYNKDGEIEDWNYRVMIPVMMQMLKTQREQINSLEDRLEKLETLLAQRGVI